MLKHTKSGLNNLVVRKHNSVINLTDKWIIQIAYGEINNNGSKNNGDTYFRVQTIEKPGNYNF